MTLFEFAMGPALKVSLTIMVFFSAWRLAAMLTRSWSHNHAPARGSRARGALRTIFSRFWPMRSFRQGTWIGHTLGYIAHIGLALVVFGGAFHIQFIDGLLGLSWPSLPPPLITLAAVLALAAFVGLLIRRLYDPVVRSLSNADDYISWTVAILPLLTGLAIKFDNYIAGSYDFMLGLHVLSFNLLLIWIPFGKLIHTFTFIPARAMTGATYGQRGVEV